MALTFGQLRERFEGSIGENVDPIVFGSWIDEAQIEISKEYGVRTSAWYPLPFTETAAEVSDAATTIPLVDVSLAPVPPETVNLGVGTRYETISYNSKSLAGLTEVTRGYNSTTTRLWPAGTPVFVIPEGGVEHDLPDDYFNIHNVYDEDDEIVWAWKLTPENKIYFLNDGMYKLVYTKVPDPIDYDDETSVPEVHPMFHSDILVYCSAKRWEEIAEGIQGEENKAMALMAQFSRKIQNTARILRRNTNEQLTLGYELW